MSQGIGLLERGARWLERRGAGSWGPRLRRFAYGPGRERVRIADLISPLRYDVLVREGYLRFLRANWDLANEDFAAFAELSRSLPYFRWFERVAVPEFWPAWGSDQSVMNAAFERRIRDVIAMFADLERGGYDSGRPIILRTGNEILPTRTGKRVSAHVYAGDGCHRLAWLRLSGVSVLEPGMYRLHNASRYTPRDDTELVLRAMDVTPREYFSFLSLAYAETTMDSESALLDHVRVTAPARVDELRNLIAIDAPLLAPQR